MILLRRNIAYIILLIFLSFSQSVFAKVIEVSGNKRIETGTILNYFDQQRVSDGDYLNDVLKQLYQTEIFSNIEIVEQEDRVIITVDENPIVNEIEFSGNKKLDKEVIIQELSLKQRGNFTKAKLNSDLQRILELYKRTGRINASVKPKVKFLEQNRIDIIFKVSENDDVKVRHIEFSGNKLFSSNELKDVISTKEDTWYRSRSANYDPDRVIYDKEILRRFYLNKGYADFKVEDNVIEYFPNKKFFLLSFSVKEGRKYYFDGFAISSQFQNVDLKPINKNIKIKEGDVFSLDAIEESKDKIEEYINDKGFAFGQVDYDIIKKSEDKIYVSFSISRDRKVFFKNINIVGNTRTYDEVIRRELKIKEGDPYNASLLKRSKQRINNLGFFNNVSFEQKPSDDPNYIDLEIKVSEKPTGELNFGVGYSTTERFLGNINIKERNLLGKAHTVFLSTQKSAISNQVDLSYKIPNFLDYNLIFGFNIFSINAEYDESLSDLETDGIGIDATYNITEYLSHSIGYSYKLNNITDVDPSASRYIRDQEGKTLQSSVTNNFYYDKRDNRLNPKDGYFIKYSNEVAGIGGGVDFLKEELGIMHLDNFLSKKLILKKIFKAGHIFAFNSDEVRINNRFFLGGPSLRGFDNAGVGPRDVEDLASLGGEIYYRGSVELSFPVGLPEELGFRGSVFSDFGTLTHIAEEKDVEIVDSGDIRVSAGFGLNWDSPLGPIRFDFIKALKKDTYDKTESFRISFGTNF